MKLSLFPLEQFRRSNSSFNLLHYIRYKYLQAVGFSSISSSRCQSIVASTNAGQMYNQQAGGGGGGGGRINSSAMQILSSTGNLKLISFAPIVNVSMLFSKHISGKLHYKFRTIFVFIIIMFYNENIKCIIRVALKRIISECTHPYENDNRP